VICPNCSAGEISPLTNRCEMCGFTPQGAVAVEAPHAEAVDDLARQELGERFRLDTFLGRGAASAVYVAREQGSDREIVVKVLPRPTEGRPDADDRFRRAVEAVAALEHPHIVPVFDHGWTEHLYWYSMDYVRGRSLRNFLLQRGPLDLKACLRVAAQVASALDHAHRRGVVHGALKPENVLIDAEGWVHLCDLLVTRALEVPPAAAPPPPPPVSGEAGEPPDSPQRQAEENRPPYIAPEGLWTPSADQYALAVMVTECLTGAPLGEPGRGAQATRLATSLPGIPPHVRHAVERALSPKPMDRFAGVLDFVAALETYAAPVPETQPSGRSSTGVLRQTDWQPPGRPTRWRLILWGAFPVAAVAAVVVWQRSAVLQVFHQVFAPTQPLLVAPLVTDSGVPVGQPPGSTLVAAPTPTPPGSTQAPPATLPSRAAPRPRAEALRQPAQPAARAPATARPRASSTPGFLFVNATPWGQLYVDGQLVGNTPKANLSVAAGPHTIRVLREGYEPFERTIQVEAGQTVRLTDITLVQHP
jgi:serine/threonine protein kinase